MTTNYTKEELVVLIYKLKSNLEYKINLEYLPLQRQMGEAEKKGEIKKYMELESKIAPLRAEVIKGYDDLLKIRDVYKSLVTK